MISLVLTLAIVGFLVWLVLQIPMPVIFRQIIVGIITIFLVLWLLQMMGVAGPFPFLRLK